MTFLILGTGHKGRRSHHSSHKASNSQPVAQSSYASQTHTHLQQQYSLPAIAAPQFPPQYTQLYGSPVAPPVQPLQSPQPYSYASPANVDAPPNRAQERPLNACWNKVDRLAAKSYHDLRDQLTSDASKSKAKLTSKSSHYFDQSTQLVNQKSTEALNCGAALCDLVSDKLDTVLTSIDGGTFSGQEEDLMVYGKPGTQEPSEPGGSRGLAAGSNVVHLRVNKSSIPITDNTSNHFSKVWLYSNSRLPPHLPPFKVYMPTYPLICLAANYAERVYTPPAPRTPEKDAHIPSDWRSGTKAMVLKSIPIDDMHTVVFAIRGSATFMDWAVNYRSAPSSPEGFLDDEGNLCHAGFLSVAKKMIQPVADRLRMLLEENPSRSHCSLLITGHSAGGAVATLLYAHMMSTKVQSDLNYLTGFFKRVHCVTFGAPPVSLLPLQRSNDKRHRKSLFYSFINEGDPVPRADKQVVKSLLKLYASPAPSASSICNSTLASLSRLNVGSNPSKTTVQTASTATSRSSKPAKSSKKAQSKTSLSSTASSQPVWNMPATTLSVAGRLVVLRNKAGSQREEDVEAVTVDDELLRTVVYGDPLKHMMGLYKRRVENLAVKAVTAGGY